MEVSFSKSCPFCSAPPPAWVEGPPGAAYACPGCKRTLLVSNTLHRYQRRALLGSGGMGEVFLAWDQRARRLVALKAIRPDLSEDISVIQAFHKEAHLLTPLKHPCLVPLLDHGEDHLGPYLVLRHIPGLTLEEYLNEHGTLPYEGWKKIGTNLISVLHYLQTHQIHHCDIKPQNILLHPRGRAFLTDFGIALTEETDQPEGADFIWGTPYYLAPERVLGNPPDISSEVYALGATLYHALLGVPPHDAPSAEELVAHLRTSPNLHWPSDISRERIPDPARAVLSKMLDPDPDKRPRNFSALAEEWKALPKRSTEARKRLFHRIMFGAIASGVAFGILAILFVKLIGGNRPTLPHSKPGPSAHTIPSPSETLPTGSSEDGQPATAEVETPPTPWERGREFLLDAQWFEAVEAWQPMMTSPTEDSSKTQFDLASLWSSVILQLRGETSAAEELLAQIRDDQGSGVTQDQIHLFESLIDILHRPIQLENHAALQALFNAKALEAPAPWWGSAFENLLNTLSGQTLQAQAAMHRALQMEQTGRWANGASVLADAADNCLAHDWKSELLENARRLRAKEQSFQKWRSENLPTKGAGTWARDQAMRTANEEPWKEEIRATRFESAEELANDLYHAARAPIVKTEFDRWREISRGLTTLFEFAVGAGRRHLGFATTVPRKDANPVTGLLTQLDRNGIVIAQADETDFSIPWPDIPAETRMAILLKLIRDEINHPEAEPRNWNQLYHSAAIVAQYWGLPEIAARCRQEADQWAPEILPGRPGLLP